MAVSGDVGLPAILALDACIHDGFVGFRNLSSEILPIYFYYHLRARQLSSLNQATGAIWQNITTDQIKEWLIPTPPFTIQEHFASIVSRFQHKREAEREALRQSEHLFQSVLHQAFSES